MIQGKEERHDKRNNFVKEENGALLSPCSFETLEGKERLLNQEIIVINMKYIKHAFQTIFFFLCHFVEFL